MGRLADSRLAAALETIFLLVELVEENVSNQPTIKFSWSIAESTELPVPTYSVFIRSYEDGKLLKELLGMRIDGDQIWFVFNGAILDRQTAARVIIENLTR